MRKCLCGLRMVAHATYAGSSVRNVIGLQFHIENIHRLILYIQEESSDYILKLIYLYNMLI